MDFVHFSSKITKFQTLSAETLNDIENRRQKIDAFVNMIIKMADVRQESI